MANKDKLLANAQKFLSKGQTPKAISEYRKLVEAFPKDVRNRQKLAELLSRDKRNEDALTEYEVVAKHYTETGFYLKSIAVFKQMQKIEPSRVDIYHRLAELNEKQGLVGNALTEYRNLVSFYEKNEMHDEAIEVLEKMAALDPESLNFSAKIAECLMALGRHEEALEKFQLIIEPFSEKGDHLKIVKLYERFLEICPEEGLSRLPLAEALLKSDSPDKAIQVLKGLLKHNPENPDINRSLADAYVAIQDFANARLTLKHLLKQKKDDLELREYYVRTCIDAGEAERARDRLEEWKDAFYEADRIVILQGFYEELKELLPGDPIVSETLSALYEAIGETAKLDDLDRSSQVSDETDVTVDAGLVDEAFDDVETLDMVGEEVATDIEPPPLETKSAADEKQPAGGLELDLDLDFEAHVTEVDEKASVEQTGAEPPSGLEDTTAPDADEDVEIEVELDLDGMDDFDLEFDEDFDAEAEEPAVEQTLAQEESETAVLPADEGGDTEAQLEHEATPEEPVPDKVDELANEDPGLPSEETGLDPTEVEDISEVSLDTSDRFEDESSEEPLASESLDDTIASLDSTEPADDFIDVAELEFTEEQEGAEPSIEAEVPVNLEVGDEAEFAEEVAAHEEDVTHEQAMEETPEEIEEIEEVEEVEALEEIEDVEELEVLEELDEVEELETLEDLDEVEELEALEELDEIEELEELEELDEIDEPATLDEVQVGNELQPENPGFAAALNVDAEMEEAEFYLQQGLYDDAERVVRTLMEYRPELPVLQEKLDEISESRQTAETESESTDFVDIMSDLQDDDLLEATDFLDSFGSDAQNDDVLSQKTVSELDSADTESHYNLGIAYKEMGLYDDAIAEFEKAALDPARSLDCTTLKGQCHMEAGDVEAAMAAFTNALSHENINDEGRMSLNFEVGMLHQMNGQLLEALESFQLVAEKDSFFRDVSTLIKNLRKELGLEDDEDDDGPQGNRDRVSYV